MLKLDTLPDRARRVFDHLATNPAMNGFTLIGGTALALQIGHRQSEDLDFWMLGDDRERMNKRSVAEILETARRAGFSTQLVTPQHKIIQHRINGGDLLAHSQDHVINGVKVTFFARGDGPYRHFDTFDRVKDTHTAFKVMGEEGLFSMKAWVIQKRQKSRDLYDLKTFLLRGKTLDQLLDAGGKAHPAYSKEFAKSVLIGDVPLDKSDEGLESIGVTESAADIHAFFRSVIDEYEQTFAQHVIENEIPRPGEPK